MTENDEAIRILAGDIERIAHVVGRLIDDFEKHRQDPDAHKPIKKIKVN